MPSPAKGARLGGGASHEKHMLGNLATALFEHGRITTTHAKGSETSDPHDPGALGKYPQPNHVANKMPGDLRLGFATYLDDEVINLSIFYV